MHAAILFEPDGYLLDGPKLMGRQSAGNGFLRAAVAGRDGESLAAYSPSRDSFDRFAASVQQIDPAAKAHWIPAARSDLLAEAGTLYRPDNAIGVSASLRLRQGMAAYSLCGVTHTLCSDNALQHVHDMFTAPVAPWDAIVCTSQAARGVIDAALDRQADYLSWRLNERCDRPEIQLPIIPLGVHIDDFASSAALRASARARLQLEDDEIAILFAGRLSFSGKAHPVAMLQGLEAAAKRTGRKIVFIQAGNFFNDKIAELYRDAATQFSPSVRAVFVNGRDLDSYTASWRAADIFLSLSDSIQETFGLTPLEAMAAGLPVIVSDWNGYKDTIRDGVDGFRIPTWGPAEEAGDAIARDYESRTGNFDFYLVRTGGAISVDRSRLDDRLTRLVSDPELRARMGASGRSRARQDYDWAVLHRQYRTLWDELGTLRRRLAAQPDWAARLDAAPTCAPAWSDPYALFGHYPTSHIGWATLVIAEAGATIDRFRALAASPLFNFSQPAVPAVQAILDALPSGGHSIGALAAQTGLPEPTIIDAVARLAKMALVRLADA